MLDIPSLSQVKPGVVLNPYMGIRIQTVCFVKEGQICWKVKYQKQLVAPHLYVSIKHILVCTLSTGRTFALILQAGLQSQHPRGTGGLDCCPFLAVHPQTT